MRLKKIILILIIALSFILSGLPLSAATGSETAQKAETASVDIKAISGNSMEMVSENQYLALYIDRASTEAAVLDKRSGKIWYTNPKGRDVDPIANGVNKDLLSSQFSIIYYNQSGQQHTMNNYTDSILNGQFKIENIKDGIRINYTLGKAEKVYVIPTFISKQRMEEKILNHLDEATKNELSSYYSLLSLNDSDSKSYKDKLLKQYPMLKKCDMYVLMPSIQDFMKKDIEATILSTGYTLQDMNDDNKANNYADSNVNKEIFNISLEYYLDKDKLMVKVPTDKITYDHKLFPLYRIQLLEYFGAADSKQQGYMLVPDGSGSLINLNNKKYKMQPYTTDVYGVDKSITLYKLPAVVEQSYLPVFGMKAGDSAFFSIIEQGDAMARIWADVAGRQNSYNNVYSEYTFIPMGQLQDEKMFGNRIIIEYPSRIFKGDIIVAYAFLNGEDANYPGMAKYYRNYLWGGQGIPRVKAKKDIPFYLEVTGAIDKVKPLLGIPVNRIEPLTTYEEAVKMLQTLKDNKIGNVTLRYDGWANGGIKSTIPIRLNLISQLGGRSGFKKLQEFTAENGIKLLPETGILYASNDKLFDGFSKAYDASRDITNLTAEAYKYNQALLYANYIVGYIITPGKIPGIVDGMMKGLKNLALHGVTIKDAATDINSDFNKHRMTDRQEALHIVAGEMKKMKASGLSLMADGGNAYSLPYVDNILNIPVDSNKFFITDASIPFYQMVVHGIKEYAGTPLNNTSDIRYQFLKALETGSGIYFSFFYRDNSLVKQSDYDYFYSNNYRAWMNEAADLYHKADAVLQDVQDQLIVNHQILQSNVVKTTFENGKEIILNYNKEPVVVNSETIEGMNFKVVREGR